MLLMMMMIIITTIRSQWWRWHTDTASVDQERLESMPVMIEEHWANNDQAESLASVSTCIHIQYGRFLLRGPSDPKEGCGSHCQGNSSIFHAAWVKLVVLFKLDVMLHRLAIYFKKKPEPLSLPQICVVLSNCRRPNWLKFVSVKVCLHISINDSRSAYKFRENWLRKSALIFMSAGRKFPKPCKWILELLDPLDRPSLSLIATVKQWDMTRDGQKV